MSLPLPEHPTYLCLDYGQAKIGLAIGSLAPSHPLEVIRYTNQSQLLKAIIRIIDQERPDALLFGWPADSLDQTTPATQAIAAFAQQLSQNTRLPLFYHSEVLTTKQAMSAMITSGLSQKRRRLMEDSYAAAAILDHYLQSQSSAL